MHNTYRNILTIPRIIYLGLNILTLIHVQNGQITYVYATDIAANLCGISVS